MRIFRASATILLVYHQDIRDIGTRTIKDAKGQKLRIAIIAHRRRNSMVRATAQIVRSSRSYAAAIDSLKLFVT